MEGRVEQAEERTAELEQQNRLLEGKVEKVEERAAELQEHNRQLDGKVEKAEQRAAELQQYYRRLEEDNVEKFKERIAEKDQNRQLKEDIGYLTKVKEDLELSEHLLRTRILAYKEPMISAREPSDARFDLYKDAGARWKRTRRWNGSRRSPYDGSNRGITIA